MAIEIRAAIQGDEALLVELTAIVHRQHWEALPECFRPLDPIEMAEWFRMRLDQPKTWIWIAVGEGVGVGCLVASLVEQAQNPFRPARRYLELEQIVVRPQWQRRGVACALVEALDAHADALGICEMELTSWSFNESAHRAFERMGFSPRYVRFVRHRAGE